MHELELFALALVAPDEAQRAEILDRECRDNPELRTRIDALIEAHFQSHSLLDREPLPQAEDPTRDCSDQYAQVDTVVAGRYKLLEPIGEGGMGTVWRAKQTEPVKRFVAVKLIKAGMDSRQVLARFEAERQALALMDHPNIAKVLDGGLHEYRPYFVMELVKGTPITEYCDIHKLTPRSRLELFINVCEAIQHAHQKGIIHRDIKPRNVLVAQYDEKPVVKVIDFGVAKATGGALTEHSINTGFGHVVGTPQYMSPEQATFNNLDVDTRSDIYALGVLLYELLTGVPPFSHQELEKVGLLEILRVVREDEPPRPSTKLSNTDALPSLAANRGTEPTRLASLLRNELDWIVMKALDKDRARRYQTAAGFAADVQRFLGGEAIQAHPPSTAYRLRKLLRQNQGPVLAASLIFLALLLGMAGTAWQAIRAEQARVAAELQQRDSEASKQRALQAAASEKNAQIQEAEQRIRAEQAMAKAEEILNAMVSGVAADSLTTQPHISEDQKAFLTNALGYYRELALEKDDGPNALARIANAAFRVGIIENRLGRMRESEIAFREARDLYQKLTETTSDSFEFRQRLALCCNNLGNAAADKGEIRAAEQNFRDAIRVQEQQAAEFPSDHERRFSLAASRALLSLLLQALGKQAEAEHELLTVCEIQEKLVREYPDLPKYQLGLAGSYLSLGAIQSRMGRPVESIQAMTTAIQVLLPRTDRDNKAKLALCDAYIERAQTYASLNQFSLALEDWDKAIELSSLSSPERQANLRASRAIAQLKLGELEESLAAISKLATDYANSKGVQYSCACFFALASSRVADKQQEYETQAVAALRRAVAAGFDDATHLKQDTDLDALRGRDDFQELATKLEQAREKK